MADPFVAEIRIFPFNFAPRGWAFCDGQLLPISQNTALFSLIGTFYGGDGKSNFALPNMQGNVPLNQGQSTTGTNYSLGQQSGVQTVDLLQTELPVHNHGAVVSGRTATARVPNNQLAAVGSGVQLYGAFPGTQTNLAFQALTPAGGSLPHNNMQPFLTLNFCIALQGVFPQRP
jgi:microcystin-dependent protein